MGSQSLVIGLAVLAWILWRQVQVRELRRDRGYLLPIALVVIGIADIESYGRDHRLHGTVVLVLATSALIAVVFGALRAATVHLWTEGDKLLRQGTYVTAALWLVGIALHIGGDHLIASHEAAQIGAVSLLLYLGLSLGVQRALLGERARRIAGSGFA